MDPKEFEVSTTRPRRWTDIIAEKLFRGFIAWVFVFMVMFFGIPWLFSKINASDHLAGLKLSDWYLMSFLVTAVVYIGFMIFRYATDHLDYHEESL